MGRAYSEDLRQRVVAAYKADTGSYAEVGRMFNVGEATVNRWVALERKTGAVTARRPGGGKVRKITLEGELLIQTLVADEPNWTTRELAEELNEALGIEVSRHTVGRMLGRLEHSFKRGLSDPKPVGALKTSGSEKPTSPTRSK